MAAQELLVLAKAVVDFFEIETGADGGAQHSKDNCKIVPPEVMDNVDTGEDA